MTAKFAKLGLVYERNDKPSFCFNTILETIQKVIIYDYKFASDESYVYLSFRAKNQYFHINLS